MSMKKRFNNDWFFAKQPLGSSLESIAEGGLDWAPVTVPHDWLIYDSLNLYESGEGWYRKSFTIAELASDTRMSLRFEGVYMNAFLYVNGKMAGTWKNGYSTFEIDITPYIKAGLNDIYVQVVHEAPNSRWYSGAGIYRSVWLKTYPATHIVADGIYIAARKENEMWQVEIDTEVSFAENAGPSPSAPYSLRYSIIDGSGALVAQTEREIATVPGETLAYSCTIIVDNPALWDIVQPARYSLIAELIEGGFVTQEERETFGFRTMEYDSQQGFFLNGRHLKLNGVCQHHDLGCLGAAVNKAALRRQIALLQEMGVNAIRTAHNMPAVELMELADEMGVLIVSEAFDMWERAKTPYDYARFFPEWREKDVASWVRRDRNHPSMLMWSIGNEIYDTHADERGQQLTRELRDMVLKHDPKGNAVVTIGSNYMPWENAQKCADIVKFAGYNYAEKHYDLHHEQHPDWIIYGSETSSTVQSRGIYHFPLAQSVLSDDDEQCSSLGNSSTSWGAKSTERCIIADRDAPYSLGQFLWSGFDYIGEPTPYHTKNSYFGQFDTAGFKKDSFYVYQAEWTDYRTSPMVHIFPYWDFSEGQLIDVRVCSNAPKIELFFNGASVGTFSIDHERGQKLIGDWQLPYAKGVLLAVAYDENGVPIAEDTKSSFGDAARLAMVPDKTVIAADGSDLIFIEISAFDEEGRTVQNANNRVRLSIDGPGRLVGLDNGDSTDYDSYKGDNRRMFSGKLLAVVAATLDTGIITVKAASNSLISGEITLEAVAPKSNVGHSDEELPLYAYAMTGEAQPSQYDADEIPIRKLEIVCPQGNELTPHNRSLPVQVSVHPSNATYREDVQWRMTNAAGIDAYEASLHASGSEAVVTALGDGDIYIRCGTNNGSDRIRLYSHMELRISGVGQACLNPYEFVSAGFYSGKSRNLTNGNERGAATSRHEESWICFDRIDFGGYGSDELTLPIFSLDSEPCPIEIWEGIPGEEDAALLTRVVYQKPSKWNVYQEETYRLPKRLKGVTSLSFVLRKKIHLKGFQFTRKLKAFEQLNALDNDGIYGDTFTLAEHSIENIGNNVSLVFRDMDFGKLDSSKLILCGHSPIDKNTVHILFSGPEGESKQLIEFTHSDDYCEREYKLEPITGIQTVTFVFLPGSQFHFKWFQFVV